MALGRTLCLLVASAALAGAAFAQAPARDAAAGGPASDRWKDHRAEWGARHQAHERQRAADIALLLRLKPEQQAAFQAMEASMRAPHDESRATGREPGEGAVLTTAQALDRMQAKLGEHEAQMRAHLDATRRFYASLSPEQQGLFDALMRLRDRAGEGGRSHGRGGSPTMMRGEAPATDDGLEPSRPPSGL